MSATTKPVTASQRQSFAADYLKAEVKANPIFGGLFKKRRDLADSLAAKMLDAYTASPPKSKAARKKFVADFLETEAKAAGGGAWLQVLFSTLLPILLKLLEAFVLTAQGSQ